MLTRDEMIVLETTAAPPYLTRKDFTSLHGASTYSKLRKLGYLELKNKEVRVTPSGMKLALQSHQETETMASRNPTVHRSGYKRKSYKRKSGTKVKATKVSATKYERERPFTAYGTKSPGPRSRAKGYSPWITHEGKLGGKGFLSKPRETQKKILDRCVKDPRWGYRSCLGSIMVLERAHRGPTGAPDKGVGAKFGRTLGTLRRYLVKKYGGKGSFGPRHNPDTFDLVPDITDCPVCQIKTNAEFRKVLENPSLAEHWEAVKGAAKGAVQGGRESYRAAMKGAQLRGQLSKTKKALSKMKKVPKESIAKIGKQVIWADKYGTTEVKVLKVGKGADQYLSVNEILPDGSYGNEIATIYPDDWLWADAFPLAKPMATARRGASKKKSAKKSKGKKKNPASLRSIMRL